MDEFDKMIFEKIGNINMPIADSVDKKIDKAFTKIENKKSKNNIKSIIKFIIEFFILLFSTGNIIAYAMQKPNVVSLIIDKLGIGNEYEENVKYVNTVIDNNGISITLKEYAINDDIIIIGYDVDFDEDVVYENVYFDEIAKMRFGDYERVLGKDRLLMQYQISKKISNKEFEIYCFYEFESKDLSNDIEFETQISCFYGDAENVKDSIIKNGNWNFQEKISKDNKVNYTYYEIDDMDVEINDFKVEMYGLKDTSMGSIVEIKFDIPYDKIGEDSFDAFLEIRDENDNIVLEKSDLYSGLTDFLVKKIDLTKNYKLIINIDNNKEELVLKPEKIKEFRDSLSKYNIETINWRDISFDLPDEWDYEIFENMLWVNKNGNIIEGELTENVTESLEAVYEIEKNNNDNYREISNKFDYVCFNDIKGIRYELYDYKSDLVKYVFLVDGKTYSFTYNKMLDVRNVVEECIKSIRK